MEVDGGVTERSGKSNGISYSCSLKKSGYWSGSCECRINKNFLDPEAPQQMQTCDLRIGGHNWILLVKKSEKNELGAFLVLPTSRSLEAHYSITLFNHTSPQKHVVCSTSELSMADAFLDGKSWGWPSILPCPAIQDDTGGFLDDDTFTLKISIRIKTNENESFSYSSTEGFAAINWCLKDLQDTVPGLELATEVITIGSSRWHFGMFPRGERTAEKYIGIYLFSHEETEQSVRFRVSLINHSTFRRDLTKELTHTFAQPFDAFGWREFSTNMILIDEVKQFVKGGWLTIQAVISEHGQVEKRNVAEASRSLSSSFPKPGQASMCVICQTCAATSGVVHGTTSHKCYCEDCVKKAESAQDKRCPVCMEPVEAFIEKYF